MNGIELFKFSLQNAFAGVKIALRTQRNLRNHLFVGAFIIALSFLLQINAIEWSLLLLTISIVLVAEFINTALEFSIDLISPQFSSLAKKAKDISAAAVLIAAFVSLIIGLIVFGPKILTLLAVAL